MERGRHRLLGQSLDLASSTDGHLSVRLRPPALSDYPGRSAARRHRWQTLQVYRRSADPVCCGGAPDDGSGVAAGPAIRSTLGGDARSAPCPTNYLPDVLETTEAERLATGFIFTEGPAMASERLLVLRRYPPK